MKRGGWRLRWCHRMQSSAAVLAGVAALAILIQAGLNAGATGVPLTSTRGGAQSAQTGGRRKASYGSGPGAAAAAVPFSFRSAGRDAGLTATTVFGGRETNRYLLETTGCGVAMFDYDADGLQDLFFVNGTTLEGFPKGQEPRPHLYRNSGNARFEDVTVAARPERSIRVGPGRVCRRLRQRRIPRPVRHLLRSQSPVPQYRPRPLRRRDRGGGARRPTTRWGTGCAFIDYDRDGRLDLFAANYIDLDLATAPTPDSGLCRYKGEPVACGPPGLKGGRNALYRNLGSGHFADVSESSGILRSAGTFGLGVSTLDFDADGWTDLYVANDSNPSALYRNSHDGTFEDVAVKAGCAYSQDGKPQAGMGVGIGDFDRNGTSDILKTNFAGDTTTLYANTGDGFCEDRTFDSGLGLNTRWLGWGAGFADFDNDGWLDIFLTNGHVYPEVRKLRTEAGYKQRKVVYRNIKRAIRRRDRHARTAGDDTEGGPRRRVRRHRQRRHRRRGRQQRARHAGSVPDPTPAGESLAAAAARRHAVQPQCDRRARPNRHRWRVAGSEVRGGGSYLSQNDLRVHVGLGTATQADRVEVRWPNGLEEIWEDVQSEPARDAGKREAARPAGGTR